MNDVNLETQTNVTLSKQIDAHKSPWLNAAVAITVSLLATFMGICKIKDDNIVQAMQQAQADKLDHWNFYQARNLREEIAMSTVATLQLLSLSKNETQKSKYETKIDYFLKIAKEQKQKKNELKNLAEKDQLKYNELNFIDDQFDLSDAAISISIALLAVTSLTELSWMYFLTLLPAAFGIFMGISGLFGLPFHPDLLIKFLS